MARTTQFPPSVKAGIPQEPKAPEWWKLVRFGDVIQVAERPVELEDDREYQLVTAKRSRGGIIPREKLLGKDILTKTQFYINAGDFLISRRQIIHGACGLVPPDLDGALVSNEYSALLTTNNLLKEYLAYFSHTNYFQQTCFQSSVGVDAEKMIFKLEDWLKYKFPLPPIAEQKKIAEILGSVDDAIAATQAVIDQTRKVKQGLLQQLLTRGIGHTKFKETAIGLIPESWTVKKLSEIGNVSYGLTVNQQRRTSINKAPYLTVANIGGSGFKLDDIKTIGIFNGDVERYSLKYGDLLLVEGNGNINSLGIAAMWRNEVPLSLHQNHLIRVRISNKSVTSEWILNCLKVPVCRSQILREVKTSSGLHTINSRVVSDVCVPVPPFKEQEEIIRGMRELEKSYDNESKKLTRLLQIKNGLMQDLLTGRVRVNG